MCVFCALNFSKSFPRTKCKRVLLKVRAAISLHTHTRFGDQSLLQNTSSIKKALFPALFPSSLSLSLSLSLSRLSQGRVKAYLVRRGLLSGRQTIIVIGRSEDLDLLSEQFKLSWPQKKKKMSEGRGGEKFLNFVQHT